MQKKLITESNDYFIVSSAKSDMASILIMNGNYDEAKSLIESMPYVYNIDIHDRMRCSTYMLRGKDRLNGAREFKVWAHQDLFACCEFEGLAFWEIGDYKNAILSFEEIEFCSSLQISLNSLYKVINFIFDSFL